jgi:cell division septum initiation protein DivIVA
MGLRGYDRAAVDAWLLEIAELVERLEEQPPPRDTAVRRALDEVGQETAAILQRAHEAAEEIEARSRAQADGRLERAEREAEQLLGEAEEHAARLEVDTRTLWDERTRLLEEMRQLADEVLGVADDAIERVSPPPDGEPQADEQGPFEAVTELREELDAPDAEAPTVEVEISRLPPDPEEPAAPGEQAVAEPDDEPPAGGGQPGAEPDPDRTRA